MTWVELMMLLLCAPVTQLSDEESTCDLVVFSSATSWRGPMQNQ